MSLIHPLNYNVIYKFECYQLMLSKNEIQYRLGLPVEVHSHWIDEWHAPWFYSQKWDNKAQCELESKGTSVKGTDQHMPHI